MTACVCVRCASALSGGIDTFGIANYPLCGVCYMRNEDEAADDMEEALRNEDEFLIASIIAARALSPNWQTSLEYRSLVNA